MALGGLFQVQNPLDRAGSMLNSAAGTYSAMTKKTGTETEAPGKSIGGAGMSALGGAAAGISMAEAVGAGASTGGWWGAAAGALLYFLS
jgi:hypothetical protein